MVTKASARCRREGLTARGDDAGAGDDASDGKAPVDDNNVFFCWTVSALVQLFVSALVSHDLGMRVTVAACKPLETLT